jgi:outer membrane biosynthesis protein TonB
MKRILLLLAFIPVAACAAAQAKPVDRPAMEVPPVPERVIEPLPLPAPEPPALPPVQELPPATQDKPRTSSKPQVRESPKPVPTPDPPVVEAPAPVIVVPSVPPLRMPNTAADTIEAARQMRDLLDRAKKSLDSVDYRALNPGQQQQYNQAKGLLEQSEDKLKAAEFELVKNYAEKAEQIAKQLQKR